MDSKELLQFIQEEKTKSSKMIEDVSEDIRFYVNKYGEKPCDYLTARRDKLTYYRGYWNALNRVHKNIEC